MNRYPDPVAGADLACDLYIPIASFGMQIVLLGRQQKEPLHALSRQVPDFLTVFPASHGQSIF
jgi:hypothetical protein